MALQLLYFAWVREAIGKDGEQVEPPAEVITVGDLVEWLSRHGEGYERAFADRVRLRAALDQRFVSFDAEIGGAAEVAIFPPVTGG